MARKPNYGFEKRMKELDRKQKQDAKLQRKADAAKQRAEEQARGVEATDAADPAGNETP